MPQSVEQFVKAASSIINYTFDGNRLQIQRFINDIKLVESLATTDVTRRICLTFINSRIKTNIQRNYNSTQEIIDALKRQQ